MMQRNERSKLMGLAVFVMASTLVFGCAEESDDSAVAVSETDGEATEEGGEATEPDTSEAEQDAEEEATTDPLILVAPEAAIADAGTECPPAFVDALEPGESTCFSVDGQDRSLYLALPGEEFEGPRPILVAFNGTGGSGPGFFEAENLQSYVDAGFIVVAPSSIGNGTVFPVWDAMHSPNDEEYPNSDLNFFDAALGCTQAHYQVDKNRMYVTGHSAGGIMTNYVLQRRSEILAGGIVASGIMSLTKPEEIETLDSMAVVVTWGGDNDDWSGESDGNNSDDEEEGGEGAPPCDTEAGEEGGEEAGEEGESEAISVPGISFVEQASIASTTYEEAEGVNQIWCKGKELGHEYLSFGNDYFMAFLLAHPKGLADNPNWAFEAPAEDVDMVCEEGAYTLDAGDVLRCEGETACEIFCDSTSVCGLSNATVSGVLEPQLDALGLPQGAEDCGPCVSQCQEIVEGDSATDQDAEVMECIATVGIDTPPFCGPGIDGVYPYVDLVNGCCAGKTDSAFCGYVCTIINENTAAQVFFTDCAAWLEETAEEGGEAAEEGGEAAEEGGEAAEEGGEAAEEGGEAAEEGGEAAEEGGEDA